MRAIFGDLAPISLLLVGEPEFVQCLPARIGGHDVCDREPHCFIHLPII